jgi:hypothetical protein
VAGGQETFYFAGHTHALCGGCGQYGELGEGEADPHCQMCGMSLKRAPA